MFLFFDLKDVADGAIHLQNGVRGMMLGRAVVSNPWKTLGQVDQLLYNDSPSILTRRRVTQYF